LIYLLLKQSRLLTWTGFLIVTGILTGCPLLGRGGSKEASQVHQGLAHMAAQIAAQPLAGPIALLPIRDGAGKADDMTTLLDGHLMSAMLRAGVDIVSVEEDPKERWTQDLLIPELIWDRLSAPYLLSVRLQGDAPWRYLQMHLLDRADRRVLTTLHQRLSQQRLDDELAAVQQAQGITRTFHPQVDLHIIFRRDEGDIARVVSLEDGGSLEQDDRLQLRFTVGQDCQVYAFLYSADAGVEEVFAKREVYSGRKLYGPGQEAWITLGENDQVYTLYFLAARNLEELGELFEQMGQLVSDGEVNRLVGLEKLDQAVVDFFALRTEAEAEVRVVRDRNEVILQEVEKFIYTDGTSLESQAEELQANSVLIRAISFAVY
jgi:hypothetical protein